MRKVGYSVGFLVVGIVLGVWLAPILRNLYYIGGTTAIVATLVIISVIAGGSFILMSCLVWRRNKIK